MSHDHDHHHDHGHEGEHQPGPHLHECGNLFGCGDEKGTGVVREDIKDGAFDKRAADRLLHMDHVEQERLDRFLSARGRARRQLLRIFGNNVEDSMGRLRFVVFYLLSGLAAALGQIVTSPTAVVPMVGASGAISGVMGAYLILYTRGGTREMFAAAGLLRA